MLWPGLPKPAKGRRGALWILTSGRIKVDRAFWPRDDQHRGHRQPARSAPDGELRNRLDLLLFTGRRRLFLPGLPGRGRTGYGLARARRRLRLGARGFRGTLGVRRGFLAVVPKPLLVPRRVDLWGCIVGFCGRARSSRRSLREQNLYRHRRALGLLVFGAAQFSGPIGFGLGEHRGGLQRSRHSRHPVGGACRAGASPRRTLEFDEERIGAHSQPRQFLQYHLCGERLAGLRRHGNDGRPRPGSEVPRTDLPARHSDRGGSHPDCLHPRRSLDCDRSRPGPIPSSKRRNRSASEHV